MSSERFEMRVPESLLARVDEARGFESRASFIRRATVVALGGARVVPSREEVAVQVSELMGSPAMQRAVELVESGGCPECGGQWQRREGVSGRWCVDCGAQEAK